VNMLRSNPAVAYALVLLFGIAHVALGAPANDDCESAIAVGEITDLAFDTSEATIDGPGHYMNSPNVWYCYTASCTGGATISLAGSGFDTKLAAYSGCDCYPTADDLITSNDDFHGQQSQVTFAVEAGQQYLIEVGGFNASVKGQGVITITCDSQAGAPSNDDCLNAEFVDHVTEMSFDTTYATFDGPGHCTPGPNLWYLYRAAGTGEVTIRLEGDDGFDPKLGVYLGNNCYPRSSDMIECNDDFSDNTLDSQVTFIANAHNYYLIEVGGYNEDTVGEGTMTITTENATPYNNDDCSNAKAISDVNDLIFDTRDATFDGSGLCMTSPNIWFIYTVSCTGNVTVSLLGSSYDTMLAVYEGNDCDLVSKDLIECNDDAPDVYQSEIGFAAIAGDQYVIEIGGYGSDAGKGLLSIFCEPIVDPNAPDLGDAPDSTNNFNIDMTAYPAPASVKASYPTVYDDGSAAGPYGPAHLNESIVAYLGKSFTRDTEADIGPDEDGINNIDPSSDSSNDDKGDDGIVLPLNLPHCTWTTFDYTVNVIDPNVDLWVNVWFDWNRDGDWDDTLDCTQGLVQEWAVQNQLLFDLFVGPNQVTTPAILSWHPEDGPEEIWMRITLSEQPWKGDGNPDAIGNGGSGPKDKYLYGETEDYYFTPGVSDNDL
jgi:hypothetical protein